MNIKSKLLNTDWFVLVVTAVIVGLGLYYLKSAHEAFFLRQIRWIVIATAAMVFCYLVDYRWLLRQAYGLYAVAFGLLVFVLMLPAKRGAQSWIEVPGTGFNIQPSEIMKLCIILVLARNLMVRDNQATIKGLIAPFALLFAPLALILKQPDLGTGILFPPLLFAMVYASGSRLWHLLTVAVAGIGAAPAMWIFVMKEYQKNRVRAFLNPEIYSAREAWQLIQSLIAIGSGGLYGMGYGEGSQNSLDLLPDKHTDFIFGVIAEEGGFVMSALMLGLYWLFVLAGLHIARKTKEPGGKLIAVGVSVIIGFQALVNIGVVSAVLPTTGITLPFISYGGSSMIVSFCMVGLLLNVSSSDELILSPAKFTGKVK